MRLTDLTLILILLIALPVAIGADDEEVIDFLELGWYNVEPWEIAICSQDFGPTEGAGDSFDSGEAVQLELFSGETIITLQAEKTDVLLDNTTVTQISYYVQPISTTVNFELSIKYASGTYEVLESGSSTVVSGYSGFQVLIKENSREQNITEARLEIEPGNIELIVPVV